jgi:type II secretory pathway pseudopilin PulG
MKALAVSSALPTPRCCEPGGVRASKPQARGDHTVRRRLGRRRQGGYTLVEAGFALVIATLLAAAGLSALARKAVDIKLDRASSEMRAMLEAGMAYYRDNNAWPVNGASDLVAGNYIPATATTGPWGGSYVVSVVGGRLQVSYNTPQTGYASIVAASLPFASVSGTVVAGQVVVPGWEIANNALLPRDGSRAMTGALNMGGQNITNANAIVASGYIYTPSYVQAATFYDAANSSYYVQPSGNSVLNRVYAESYVQTPTLYDLNNNNYYLQPSNASHLNQLYASIIYDQDNPAYYLDPNGTSVTNTINTSYLYDRTKGVYNDQAVHTVSIQSPGDSVAKPTCYAGHTPQIYVAPAAYSMNGTAAPIGGVQTWAVNEGSSWQVNMSIYVSSGAFTPTSSYGKILVMTNCQ